MCEVRVMVSVMGQKPESAMPCKYMFVLLCQLAQLASSETVSEAEVKK